MGIFQGAAIGLYTSPNPFSASPAGSLSVADNVIFPSVGTIEPRRGMSVWTVGDSHSIFGNPNSRGDSLAFYGTTVLLAYDSTKVAFKPASYIFTDFVGTFIPPSDNRMRFMPAVKSMFFNTTLGLFDYDGVGEPYRAGCPTGSSISGVNSSLNGWMSSDSAVAYRFTICLKDAFGRIIEGPPSGRFVIRNILNVAPGLLIHNGGGSSTVSATAVNGAQQPHYLNIGDVVTPTPGELTGIGGSNLGFSNVPVTVASIPSSSSFTYNDGQVTAFSYYSTVTQNFEITRSVDLTLYFPTGTLGQPVNTNNFFRVYRSDETFSAVDEPTDDMFQCYETPYMSSLDIARGFFQFSDITPQNSLGNELYTSPNFTAGEGGAKAAQYPPPIAHDMTYFANRAWYANTTNKESVFISLIGVGAPDGLQNFEGISVKVGNDANLDFLGVTTNPILATPVNAAFSSAPLGGNLSADTYWYRVVALDGAGSTLPSTETSEMVVFGGNTSIVTVNWGAVAGATGYEVYGRTQGAEQRIAVLGAVTSYIDTGAVMPSGSPPVKNTTGQQMFELFTDSDPGYNIARTAQALVFSMNNCLFNTKWYAYYMSSESGIPGQILLVAREFGDSFQMKLYQGGAHGSAWNPQLPDQFAPAWDPPTSDNNRHPAGIYYSRLEHPEGVPPLNYLLVDQDNEAILRVFPLHYRLIVFKTNGIYYVTNVAPFTVFKLSEYRLVAPDSLAIIEDRLYALTDVGMIVITDAGINQISNPVDAAITRLGNPTSLPHLKRTTLGLSYRSMRQYLCWMIDEYINPSGLPDFTTDNAQALVYSTESNGFTRYTFGVHAAVVDPTSDRLIVAPMNDNRLWIENKSLTLDDYRDLTSAAEVKTCVGSVLEMYFENTTTPLTGVKVGDVFKFAGDPFIVINVSNTVGTFTVLGTPGWTIGNVIQVFEGIQTRVEFNKLTSGSPGLMKFVDQVSYLFRSNSIYDTTSFFSTEINTVPVSVELVNDVWNQFSWGDLPYGSLTRQVTRVQPLPLDVGDAAQLSVGFATRQALGAFIFLGIDVVAKPDTEQNRG